jgi:alkaline phosphatase D
MTAAPASSADELNFFRVPGSSVFERHFALLDFSGPEDDRRLTLRVMSIEGNELFRREIRAQNLQHGDGP